jgi:hypothetical protein
VTWYNGAPAGPRAGDSGRLGEGKSERASAGTISYAVGACETDLPCPRLLDTTEGRRGGPALIEGES